MDKIRETFFSLQLPYCDRLDLERTLYRGGSGPRVAVVSGVHGDELEGLLVCHLLAEWLEQSDSGCLQGQVELYPALNPLALDSGTRAVPLYGADLNRSFPGHSHGLLPQQLAAAAMRALTGCALVVDVHGGSAGIRESPQVRFSSRFQDRLMPMAEAISPGVIWCLESAKVLPASMSHSLNTAGVPCLVMELGAAAALTADYALRTATGILRAWRDLGVIRADVSLPEVDVAPLLAGDHNMRELRAAASGLFVSDARVARAVAPGETLGRIVSPFDGVALAHLETPVGGFLCSLRVSPLVYRGTLLARVVAADGGPRPATEAPD